MLPVGSGLGVGPWDFDLQAPSLIPASAKSLEAGPPSPPWARPSVVTGGGAKPSGPHYPNPGLSLSMGPLEGMVCEVARWGGVASCSAAQAGSLDVPHGLRVLTAAPQPLLLLRWGSSHRASDSVTCS